MTKNLLTDKYFCASYLNMARHNIYLVLNDIAAQVKKKPLENEDAILSNSILTPLNPDARGKSEDELLKIVELLTRKFPFMEALMEEFLYISNKYKRGDERKDKANLSDYHALFELLFRQMNSSRNEYTHVYKEVSPFNADLLRCLKRVYDASVDKTKDQFGFLPNEVEHLRRKKANPDRNSAQKVIEKPGFKFSFEKDGVVTEKGMAFFICLFLEKKYAYLMLKQMYGFKDGTNNAARASLETFCAYSIKMPKMRIESTSEENLLYMDMINELKRCPSDLYEHLSEAEQKRFKLKIEAEKDSQELEPEALLKRHDDRFTYFVMRYIDEAKLFDKGRFMMDLGNYNFHVYEKVIDGEMRIRRLNKKLTSFGRFQDYSLEKLYDTYKDKVKPSSEIEEDNKEKYIVETYPHYHFSDDNIGIKFIDEKSNLYPKLENATDKGAPKTLAPDIWMSRHELMPMVLYTYLAQKERVPYNAAEDLMYKHRERIHRFFKDIRDGKTPKLEEIALKYDGLDIHDIPKELLNFLNGKTPVTFEIVAKKKIETMIEESEKRLTRLERDLNKEERKNKIGKKDHREVKSGILADYIAKDLMALQPNPENAIDGKGKATGLTFQVLQAKIAFYGAKKTELRAMFEECELIGKTNPHPFLPDMKFDTYKDIIAFYRAYLNTRIDFLVKCQKERKYNTYSWLRNNKVRRRNAEKDFIQNVAKNYLKMPISFPRGLFQEEIKKILLAKSKTQSFQNVINNAPRVNTSFMIEKYYECELEDNPQAFYFEKRTYKLFNQLKDNRTNKRDTLQEKFFTTKEFIEMLAPLDKWIARKPKKNQKGDDEQASKKKALILFEKNEKSIRQEKAKDMVLFLMVKDLMLKSKDITLAENIEQFKLKEIAPDSEIGILSQQKTFEVTLQFTEMIDRKLKAENKISKKITATLKYKNYGDFRRFIKDRRLNNLMFFIDAETIEKKTLETELEEYDKARIEVFRLVSDFEKVAYPRYKSQLTAADDKKNEHGTLLNCFATEYPEYQVFIKQIKNIRNAFSHNQYPEYHLFKDVVKQRDFPIAKTFVTFATVQYEAFTDRLKRKV